MDQRVVDVILELQADPGMRGYNTPRDIGGCLTTARRFALALADRDVAYAIRRYKSLAGWRTAQQHVVVVDGNVVDWIAPQFRADSTWPDVRTVAEFEEEFGQPDLDAICPRCGSGGDLGSDLQLGPLDAHDCPGPAERLHQERIVRVLEGLPPWQLVQLGECLR